ncbi:hypothetical protein SAMN05216605_10747 [Pseudomonas abietaniphila]|uniref:Uncharacterized protein n=1 Tax=Pseudomonas abietaniphila TaxID=89065 RepID=A0A1G8DHE3_9PSED|nr:hypothetical protein SAMN05216605_10747 [Pseudomonas abietaniphila]
MFAKPFFSGALALKGLKPNDQGASNIGTPGAPATELDR